jgi:hypothetical protein
MRFTITVISLLLVAVSHAQARQLPRLVPEGWVLDFTDAASRTRRFVSPDGGSTLTARQTRSNPADLHGDIDRTAFHAGEQITYLRRAPTWVAVSGYRKGMIFYRKSNLACGGTRWNQVELVYSRADKRAMDRTVTHIAHGMTEYEADCR